MSKIVKDVTLNEKELSFNVTYKDKDEDDKTSSISIYLDNIKQNFVYQNKFFYRWK